MDAPSEVAAVLRRLSEAWRNRQYAELRECVHEGVVMTLPGFSERVIGRDPLVESYRAFMEASRLDNYREEPPTIDVWGDTAIAYYHWEMGWASGGNAHHASGYDVFAFSREPKGGKWRAVWRTMLFDEAR